MVWILWFGVFFGILWYEFESLVRLLLLFFIVWRSVRFCVFGWLLWCRGSLSVWVVFSILRVSLVVVIFCGLRCRVKGSRRCWRILRFLWI